MLLSARILSPLANVNDFDYAQVHQMTAGEASDIYFQLIDAGRNPPTAYFFPFGLRYMPATGATLQCTLASINDAQTVIRYATQPYPTQDPSIWKLSVLPTDQIGGTFALKLSLNEGGVVKKGVLQQAVSIASNTQSFC